VPARSADDVRIETYSGSRVNLCPLFELAEDSAAELDSYIESGRILAAVSGGEVIGHLQLTGAVDPRQVEIKNSHAGERAHACGAYWHTRAAWATMPGWLVMIARPRRRCGGALCAFWTGQAVADARVGASCRPRCYPGRRRGRALGRRAPAAGPGRVGRRCWLRAGGVGPWHGSADRGRGARELPAANGPDAQAWHTGPGYRRDGNTRSSSAIAVLPPVGAVAPAPPAAADAARDRRGSPERRV
jgi:hypothetical protein